MSRAQALITENIATWTGAIQARSTSGRGSSNKYELYGIKKLRELILELAVRGKLVPQDSNDEPASVLLGRIAAEKAELIKAKKIKKPKALPPISDEEKPFELPEGWEWVRFGNIYQLEYGNNLPQNKRSNSGEFPVYGSNGVVGSHNEHSVDSACIVVGRKGSAGALNLSMSNGCWVTDVAYSCTPPSEIDLKFSFKLFHTLNLNNLGKGIKPGLNRNEAYILVLAIPPLAEQQRIVQKVDELMALCDQLEQQTESSIEAHSTLVDTLLATLSNSADADELQQNWAKIAEHFDTLFITERNIDALKQTILQLAVMGKLVRQNPNDEPASVLLERIAEEKDRLVKEKKIKKQKPLPEISENEKLLELPEGWEWVRFGQLIPQFQNGASSRGDKDGQPVTVLRLADIKNWHISLSETRELPISQDSIEKYSIEKGDALIVRVNGSANIVGRFIPCTKSYDAIYCDHFIRLRFPYPCFTMGYTSILGSSAIVRNTIANLFISTAGQKTINQGHISSIVVPLAPLAEQHRIVAKVNELMALCEQLKDKLWKSQQTQVHLTDAIVEQAIVGEQGV